MTEEERSNKRIAMRWMNDRIIALCEEAEHTSALNLYRRKQILTIITVLNAEVERLWEEIHGHKKEG